MGNAGRVAIAVRAAGRAVLVVLALLCLSACSGRAVEDTGRGRPDIFLYVVDALRADHLGCYGYTRDTSPRLDRFAQENTLFLRAYAQTSWTRASAASMLSGLPPRLHRLVDRDDAFPEEIVTLAERLRQGGYETIGLVANGHLHAVYGFAQGFDVYEYLGLVSSARVHVALEETLRPRLARTDRPPLFVFVWTIDPHDPYEPETEDAGLFSIGAYEPIAATEGNLVAAINAGAVRPTLSQRKYLEARYDQEIRGNDRAFGRLLDFLAAAGLADEAVIMFTADHGEEFFDHGGVGHGRTLYEEQVRVPLVVRAPGYLVPGRRFDRVQHIDIYPTVLEMAGLDRPGGLMGLPLGASAGGARPLYFDLALDGRDLTALLADRKIVYAGPRDRAGPIFEVFDPDDPGELRPRAPETLEELRLEQRILEYRTRLESPYSHATAGRDRIPQDVREHLRTLGCLK